MARIRSVKPALRTSRTVAQWRREVRYFWVLLWGYLDDEGRGLDIPKAIAGDCFPLDDDVTPGTVDRWIAIMARKPTEFGREAPVCRYEISGTKYLHAVNWGEHQRPNRPSPSRYPQCPVHDKLTESLTEPLTEPFTEPPLSPQVLELGSRKKELEGAAREPVSEPPAPSPLGPEPPRQCQDHRDDPEPPPCRRCKTTRERWQAWDAEKRRRANEAPDCPDHPGSPAHNCGLCRSERIAREVA